MCITALLAWNINGPGFIWGMGGVKMFFAFLDVDA